MFISKSEKEELHQKIERLKFLVGQASDRAQNSEEKLLELSMKISGLQDGVIQQQLKTVEFIDKLREQMRALYNDQKMKQEKVLAVEKLLEMTRGVLFSLKKEVSINRGDLLNLSKIAVVREEPAFALDGGEKPPEVKAVKTRRTRSTKGIKIGPLVTTPEAPWGLKKDGTPRKRPGRALKEVVV